MAYPYKGRFVISQTFLNKNTYYSSGYHLGIDLVGLDDKRIYSVSSGYVYDITTTGAFGNSVVVKMTNGLYCRYSHLSQINVKKGEYVREGAYQIGVQGRSGSVYSNNGGDPSHLDLRISKYSHHTDNTNDYINPAEYLGFPNQLNYIVNPKKEDDVVIFKNVIIVKEGIDEKSAGLLENKLNAPVILSKYIEGLTTKQIENIAENIYQVGFADKICEKAKVICGSNRWTTAEEVIKRCK